MSNYRIKRQPPIKLEDLLKKRKANLSNFLKMTGISTYAALIEKCNKIGVSAPKEEVFRSALGEQVSSPQEGIVVLDPPKLTKDSGEKILVDSFVDHLDQKTEDLQTEVVHESEEKLDTISESQESEQKTALVFPTFSKNKKNRKVPLETLDSVHQSED